MAAPEASLRKRKTGDADPAPGPPPAAGRDSADSPARLRSGTFWLTRIVLLKALAFVYCVAFWVAFRQNKQLIGDRGLLPCKAYLARVQRHFQGRRGWEALSSAPTVLWLLDWSNMNFNLDLLALLGLGISSFVLITGCANMVLMAALWVLYLSLVNVGQVWYSFGWESQLLETGFLGVFLCPLWTLARLPRHSPTSRVVLWGFRWLVFRIMLGAVHSESSTRGFVAGVSREPVLGEPHGRQGRVDAGTSGRLVQLLCVVVCGEAPVAVLSGPQLQTEGRQRGARPGVRGAEVSEGRRRGPLQMLLELGR
ncbi:PREDICTED: lipase maturation factor 1-like, partial [Propithecus coquereli]|uniref:lipase maturation factor 1-like n=1 Tax=Propithecus coquereli TaxID=379532 RepID=UPI00063F06EF